MIRDSFFMFLLLLSLWEPWRRPGFVGSKSEKHDLVIFVAFNFEIVLKVLVGT